MFRLVSETTRFSDARYPHAFDEQHQAHVYRVASVSPRGWGDYYLVDHAGEYFLFQVMDHWITDLAAQEKFVRLTPTRINAWQRVDRKGNGNLFDGLEPSTQDPTIALRLLQEALVLCDDLGRTHPDGQRRVVEEIDGVRTVSTVSVYGHSSEAVSLPAEPQGPLVTTTSGASAEIVSSKVDPRGFTTHTFHWHDQTWAASTRRYSEHDIATGESYVITESGAPTRKDPPPPYISTRKYKKAVSQRNSERVWELLRTASANAAPPATSREIREAKLAFAHALLTALAQSGRSDRAEQFFIAEGARTMSHRYANSTPCPPSEGNAHRIRARGRNEKRTSLAGASHNGKSVSLLQANFLLGSRPSAPRSNLSTPRGARPVCDRIL